MFSNLPNVLLIVLGFGLVIFIHELGHFLAARWAGIRVHAFAIGFGPAIASWRKGLGLRAGSSEPEYLKRGGSDAAGLSPTEYRLNWFPFGGYVKMLGQEDAAPMATSDAADSYTSKPVWKRMIVISAGVVMNVILAAVLFVIVFMVGMREVAPVIGVVVPGGPADSAGLRVGDIVRSIDGEPTTTFTDIQVATAMAGPGETLLFGVDRPTAAGFESLVLNVTPTVGGGARLMQVGVGPASGPVIPPRPIRASDRAYAEEQMSAAGFASVPMGSVISKIDGVAIDHGGGPATLIPLERAAAASGGRAIGVTFAPGRGDGPDVTASVTPEPRFQRAFTTLGGKPAPVDHLLGLVPLVKAGSVEPAGSKAGLREGDIFLRVGDRVFPDAAAVIEAVRAKKGGTIPLVVLRGGEPVELLAPVSNEGEGRIGFGVGEAVDTTLIARVSGLSADQEFKAPAASPLAALLDGLPAGRGLRVTSVQGRPVGSFSDVFAVLRDVVGAGGLSGASIAFGLEIVDPITLETDSSERTVSLTSEEADLLRGLSWRIPPRVEGVFQPVQVIVKATDPWHAVGMGITKTKRVLVMTYLTFARLFQGTVRVEHLKGPVGIADMGARFAEEGWTYLLFFLGLISANLAVVNFLPLPIVDGGHFLMLCYEGLAKRPVPIRVQNAVTMAGLALIGTMFLLVTFNDVVNLFK